MGILEEVMQMKSQGIPEKDIIQKLQGKGKNPREISDALEQSKIKSAVSNNEQEQTQKKMEREQMQPSMMEENLSETQEPSGNYYQPQQNQNYQNSQPQEYAPQIQRTYGQQQPVSEEYYSQDSYGGEEYAPSQGNMDSIIEISEQVFLEKIKKFQSQIHEIAEFSTIYKTKIENIEDRLKRMEKMFDQMQISVIQKVGSYGKGLESLKKEIEMVEDSFSKVVNKTTDSKHKIHSKKK